MFWEFLVLGWLAAEPWGGCSPEGGGVLLCSCAQVICVHNMFSLSSFVENQEKKMAETQTLNFGPEW